MYLPIMYYCNRRTEHNPLNLLSPAPDDAEIEGAAHNDDAAEGGEAEPAPAEPAGKVHVTVL